MADQAEIRDDECRELVKTLANLRLEGEDDGRDEGTTIEWDWQDSYETLAHLIEKAREAVGHSGYPAKEA